MISVNSVNSLHGPDMPKLRCNIVQRVASSSTLFHPPQSEDNQPNKLIISNLKSRSQLHYGGQFKHLLQARDQVLEHPFCFEYNLQDESLLKPHQHLADSLLFEKIKKNTKKFLVESASNVISSGFKFLLDKQLDDKQSSEFTAKNIMINSQAIYRQTINSISNKTCLRNRTNIQGLRVNLILQVDNILENILVNLADGYPQAPPSGGTPRMRQAINEVNRVEDEENDFIFTSGIKISDYLQDKLSPRGDGNYTQFIMNVINEAILVTQDNSMDYRQRTVFEKFTEFNEHLFWLSQQKEYQQIISQVDNDSQPLKRLQKTKIICKQFDSILSNKEVSQKEELRMDGRMRERYSRQGSRTNDDIRVKMDSLRSKVEDGVAQMKRDKQFALGQKIASSVKPFNRQEIAGSQFSSKHSSIIRIMTKWAQYLQDVFKNAQKMVRQRKYPFTNVLNQLINLNEDQHIADGQDKLIERLGQEYQEVKKKFSDILRRGYETMGKFLSQTQPESFISNVSRFTQTRTASSKINAVLATLMLQYTNILIHHLLIAGQNIRADQFAHGSWNHNINLVIFRVSDLMRSKLQCSQSGFISLVKTMYLLDNSQTMREQFKLIRIKNKLDSPSNNIMINYLFMGKVQCELQLSIQEPRGKEKNYYTFSHMVYELTRGMFGSIAECAMMISQLDPMIAACKGSYYQEKNKNASKYEQKDQMKKSFIERANAQMRHAAEAVFFQCAQCYKLITNQRTQILFPQQRNKICYQCIIQGRQPQRFLRNDLRDIFYALQHRHIANSQSILQLQHEQYLVQLTAAGETKLFAVIHFQKQMKHFCIQIHQKILKQVEENQIDFATLDYLDLSHFANKSGTQPATTLAYLFEDIASIPEKVLELVKVSGKDLGRVGCLLAEFREFREEKNIIKTIKYKAEIIKVKGEEGRVLDKVCRALVLKQQNKGPLKLKYLRYRHLDLSNIRQITAPRIDLQQIPKWMRQCHNLSKLELQKNKIKGKIGQFQLPPSLTYLDLMQNGIQSFDVSQLTSLITLDLRQNELTMFDISHKNSLVTLSLSQNKLSSFNISNSNNLSTLDLRQNKLTSFEISNNDSLTTLHLSSNHLITFNIGNNNTLTRLHLFKNQLTSFDTGQNNSLLYLHLSYNNLSNLNLRQNRTLKQLSISNNSLLPDVNYLPPSLQQLFAQRRQVIHFDFQHLINLKELYVYKGITQREEFIHLGDPVYFQYRV